MSLSYHQNSRLITFMSSLVHFVHSFVWFRLSVYIVLPPMTDNETQLQIANESVVRIQERERKRRDDVKGFREVFVGPSEWERERDRSSFSVISSICTAETNLLGPNSRKIRIRTITYEMFHLLSFCVYVCVMKSFVGHRKVLSLNRVLFSFTRHLYKVYEFSSNIVKISNNISKYSRLAIFFSMKSVTGKFCGIT